MRLLKEVWGAGADDSVTESGQVVRTGIPVWSGQAERGAQELVDNTWVSLLGLGPTLQGVYDCSFAWTSIAIVAATSHW